MKLRTRPIMLGAVLLLLLGAVSVWDWRRRVGVWRDHLRGYHVGLCGSVTRALQGAVRDDGSIDEAAARAILERVLRAAAHLRVVALLRDGRVVVRCGAPTPDLEPVPASGERAHGDLLLLYGSTSVDRLPPLLPFGVTRLGPPPPRPEQLAPGARFDETDRLHGTLAFGYDAGSSSARARDEALDVASRAAFVLLAAGALGATYAAGRRAERHAAALALERTRSRSLEEVGLTAAGLAHETKNPLGIIVGLAQQISRDDAVPPEHRLRAAQVIDAADRAAERLGEFIHYTRLRDPALGRVDLAALVGEVVDLLEPEARALGVELVAEVAVPAVTADRGMLQQVLVNLVMNSIQASTTGGRVVVRAARQGAEARLEVQDQGHGIPDALRPRVFEPYVTGRADGHGLGLAIVRRLADLHGWTIALESEPGRGTLVRLDDVELASLPEEDA